jgi:cob(I)alamin adenosyltransferase
VRTNHLAGTLKVWCKKKMPLQQQLDQLQSQINDIQMQPLDRQDHTLEANLVAQYEGSMTKLNEFYKQRAKKHWVTQGDRNTAFFHQVVTKRRRRNRIVSIMDSQGQDLFDPQDIANEFITYFCNIF